MKQKIIPHLWFASEAEAAAALYTSIFPSSRIGHVARYGQAGFEIHGQKEGTVMTIEFELAGQAFMALNGGPAYTINPSVSFLVACDTKDEVDTLWSALSPGGSALMELGSYPFSERYVWVVDRFGVSWQLMYNGGQPITQKITPTMMFVGDVCGRAEEAVNFYASVFRDASVGDMLRYGEGEAPDGPGTIKYIGFTLLGQQFAAMDSAHAHKFGFNEAVSLIVMCDDQTEVDYYWDKLKDGGDEAAQQCGWLKDKFGFSWQVIPQELNALMSSPDREKTERVMTEFLKMKKLDIAVLQRAYRGD